MIIPSETGRLSDIFSYNHFSVTQPVLKSMSQNDVHSHYNNQCKKFALLGVHYL